ncbi:TrbG/VirB9 family P-type conjugative transfer protein [Anaplasmataceae bacterium AB001_6]|nr:TrbG/VirB9 family P-type conjugative transfer protein [Anaplasmataceae bacterium AB001_6]
MSRYISFFIFLLFGICHINLLYAVIHHYNSPIAVDSRVKIYVYSPNEVFIISGNHEYKTFLEFSQDEYVTYASTGDGVSWSVNQDDNYPNVIILQPSEKSARTNMVVFTNKRKYLFDLIAKEEFDVDIAYSVKFYYVEEEIEDHFDYPGKMIDSNIDKITEEDLERFELKDEDDVNSPYKKYVEKAISEEHSKHAEANAVEVEKTSQKHNYHNLNFSYDIAGDKEIMPYEVFDNGKVTFIKFPMSDAYLPNIFALNKDSSESALKMVLFKDYVVINGVHQKLTMRFKELKVNVYNKGFRYEE